MQDRKICPERIALCLPYRDTADAPCRLEQSLLPLFRENLHTVAQQLHREWKALVNFWQIWQFITREHTSQALLEIRRRSFDICALIQKIIDQSGSRTKPLPALKRFGINFQPETPRSTIHRGGRGHIAAKNSLRV